MKYHFTLALHFLLLTIVPIQGQNGHPHFRNYSTADGLPSSEVYTAFEDSQGYIWFGTDNGVSRFNGYEFENFGASEGLMDNVVFHIKEDSQGRIWMNSMSGRLFYYEEGKIHPYAFNQIFKDHKSKFVTPTGFQFDKAGNLVIGLWGWGILQIDRNGNYTQLSGGLDASMFFTEVEGELIYANVLHKNLTPKVLKELRDQTLTFCLIKADTNIYHSISRIDIGLNNFIAFKYADRFNLLVGDLLLQTDKSLNVLQSKNVNFSLAAAIPGKDETLWIGLKQGKGIRKYSGRNNLLSSQFETYLAGYSISKIIVDGSGGYWLTSLENGIFYTSSLDYLVFDELSGIVSDNITTLACKTDTSFYFGIRNGYIYEFNAGTNQVELVKEGNDKEEVHDLVYDSSQDQLWKAGTTVGYLKNQQWFGIDNIYSSFKAKLSGKGLFLSKDHQSIWSYQHGGFHKVDTKSKKLVYNSYLTLLIRRTLAIFEDSGGRIWVGNVDGLFEYRDSTLHSVEHPNPIFKMRVEDIDQLPSGALVVATKGRGVAIWDENKIHLIDESIGLTSNMVENIYIDSQKVIWVGTLAGLNKVSTNELLSAPKVEPITTAHGLPSNEINDISALHDRIWVATSEGLVSLPKDLPNNPNTYPPILQSVLVNNQSTTPNSTQSYPYQSNNWQFHFFSPNYKFPGKIPYRYKTHAYDEWSYTTNPSINFAKLAPGTYRFEVQAQNEDRLWSDSLLVPFTINAPFWQKPIFQLLGISALLSFVILLFNRRLKRIQQEAATKQEINELKRAALQAQMNPHFVFNCLNSIQQFIAIGDKRNALHYLSRFAQLIRNTLQASTKTRIALEDEVIMLSNYIELEKARFGNRFDFTITIDPKIDAFELEIPPLLIQPYVENAIVHGLNNLDRKGQIDIIYTLEGSDLKVSVSDNGIGIYQSKQVERKSDSTKQSLGMSITQKRLQLVQAIESTDDPVTITERKNTDGQVMGTTIEILLKNLNAEPEF